MSAPDRLVKFQLLGQNFAFYTGTSDEEMKEILSLVKRQVEDNGGEAGGTVQVGKVAVMACLNMASRYIKLKKDFEVYQGRMDEKLGALNEKLDMVFSAEK